MDVFSFPVILIGLAILCVGVAVGLAERRLNRLRRDRTAYPSAESVLQGGPRWFVLGAFAFVLAGLGAACWHPPIAAGTQVTDTQQTAARATTGGATQVRRCRVTGFRDGGHAVPTPVPECLKQIVDQTRAAIPLELRLVGGVDKREMRRQARRTYGDNLSLATQRALAVKDYLHGLSWNGATSWMALEPRIALFAAGAQSVGEAIAEDVLKADRRVEVMAIWAVEQPENAIADGAPKQQPTGLIFNETFLDRQTSLALLAVLIALSAYLATIRIFLKQADAPDHVKKFGLIMLTVGDLPMISSALLLGFHVIFRAPVWTAHWSLLLFVFAGIVLVILHAREWVQSAIKLWPRAAAPSANEVATNTPANPSAVTPPAAAAPVGTKPAPIAPTVTPKAAGGHEENGGGVKSPPAT